MRLRRARWTWWWVGWGLFTLLVPMVLLLVIGASGVARFFAGEALVATGALLQDQVDAFDFEHGDDITPQQVWQEFRAENDVSVGLRTALPHRAHHPAIAMLVCMDARLDVAEMTGDTRHVAYVVRTAGSVIGEAEEEMLELAVLRGVKLLVLTRHTDCAAEAIAADPQQRARFPALAEAIDARDRRVTGFLARPAIASRVAEGTLLVKEVLIDTSTERVTEVVAAHQH